MDMPTQEVPAPLDGPPPPPQRPAYKLFSSGCVIIATIVGSVLAGGALLALNFRRLGRPRAAWITLGVSVAASAAVLAMAFLVPDSMMSEKAMRAVLIGIQVVIASVVSRVVMGKEFDHHTSLGGRFAPKWAAAGIGVLVCAIFIALMFALSSLAPSGNTLKVSELEEVQYDGGATLGDAHKVADVLKRIGFFDGARRKTVIISRAPSGSVVSFCVRDGAWEKPEAIHDFEFIGGKLADLLGHPMTVELVDKSGTRWKTIPIK